MDEQRFDWLARQFGAQPSRRRLLASLSGLAVAAAVPLKQASAGSLCSLVCPFDIGLYTNGETCTVAATWGNLANPSGCAEESFGASCDFDSGDLFPLGTTTVNCQSLVPPLSCQFTVSGYDGGAIYATCPADINVEADAPTPVSYPTVMIGTLCTPNTAPANCDHESGDTFPLGSTTVTCSVSQGAGSPSGACSFNITLAPGQATATNTPTEVPGDPTATPTDVPATTAPTTIPGDPTATDVPATIAPTTVPGDPTATTAPVTELPNTGTGDGGSGTMTKLLPVAIGGAGVALLTRLGLRQRTAEAPVPLDK